MSRQSKASSKIQRMRFDWIDAGLIFLAMPLVTAIYYGFQWLFGFSIDPAVFGDHNSSFLGPLVFCGPLLRRRFRKPTPVGNIELDQELNREFSILRLLGTLVMFFAMLAGAFWFFINVGSLDKILKEPAYLQEMLLFWTICSGAFAAGAFLDRIAS